MNYLNNKKIVNYHLYDSFFPSKNEKPYFYEWIIIFLNVAATSPMKYKRRKGQKTGKSKISNQVAINAKKEAIIKSFQNSNSEIERIKGLNSPFYSLLCSSLFKGFTLFRASHNHTRRYLNQFLVFLEE